jgi:hypothetical protein
MNWQQHWPRLVARSTHKGLGMYFCRLTPSCILTSLTSSSTAGHSSALRATTTNITD